MIVLGTQYAVPCRYFSYENNALLTYKDVISLLSL